MKILKKTASTLIPPAILMIAFLISYIIFLFYLYRESDSEQKAEILKTAEHAGKSLEYKLNGNLDFLKLLAVERANGHLTIQNFQTQVEQYLNDHPEFINITWVDSGFNIKTVWPLKGNAHIIGLHIGLPEPKRASTLARETRESQYTKPFEAIQSEPSFEVWVPVYNNENFLGLFAGVYSCKKILKQIELTDRFIGGNLRLVDENMVELAEVPGKSLYGKIIFNQYPFQTLNNGMILRVEMKSKQPFSLIVIILSTLCLLFVITFAYSLWKIRSEIYLRKQIQDSLQQNQTILNKKNEEYLLINQELNESNEIVNKINKELILAKERAEESDRLKTAFLQNMSHEIRTPMNAIVGFSDLLSENQKNSSKIEKYTRIIKQRSNELLDIINDMLDIAKIESGHVTINSDPCIVADLFRDLNLFFTDYQKRIKKENIEFRINTNGLPLDFIFNTDAGKLKQILINLITNAFKFTVSGSIECGCNIDENSKLEFYVKDTGIGIAPDKHEKVFERFAQLTRKGNHFVSGTGLGLTIVKGLTELLGGKIWLQSEPEKGSTFRFTIPILNRR